MHTPISPLDFAEFFESAALLAGVMRILASRPTVAEQEHGVTIWTVRAKRERMPRVLVGWYSREDARFIERELRDLLQPDYEPVKGFASKARDVSTSNPYKTATRENDYGYLTAAVV